MGIKNKLAYIAIAGILLLTSCVPTKRLREQEEKVAILRQTILSNDQQHALEIKQLNDQNEVSKKLYQDQIDNWITRFDTTVNHYINLGNRNMEKINDEFSTILTSKTRTNIRLLNTALQGQLKEFEISGVEVKSGTRAVVVTIYMDSIYSSETFSLNKTGQALVAKLNSEIITSAVNDEFYIKALNQSIFEVDSSIVHRTNPSPFLTDFIDSLSSLKVEPISRAYYSHDFIPNKYNFNHLGDRFIITFTNSIPKLSKYKVDEIAFRGEMVKETIIKTFHPSDSYIGHSMNEPISITYNPEKTTKYLLLPSVYRFAKLKNPSLTDEEIAAIVKDLEKKDKVFKYFDGEMPESIPCKRHYALVVLKDGKKLYKTDRIFLDCNSNIFLK